MHVPPKPAAACISTLEILLQQGSGYWQHLHPVPKELLSKVLDLPVDEQQAAVAEQSLQQQSLCIRSGFAQIALYMQM